MAFSYNKQTFTKEFEEFTHSNQIQEIMGRFCQYHQIQMELKTKRKIWWLSEYPNQTFTTLEGLLYSWYNFPIVFELVSENDYVECNGPTTHGPFLPMHLLKKISPLNASKDLFYKTGALPQLKESEKKVIGPLKLCVHRSGHLSYQVPSDHQGYGSQ
jgi:hypothetical protein